MKTFKVIFLFTALLLSCMSCKKGKSTCYDSQLYRQHKNDICTTDCPSVIGCDDKMYCNECDAQRNGISVK